MKTSAHSHPSTPSCLDSSSQEDNGNIAEEKRSKERRTTGTRPRVTVPEAKLQINEAPIPEGVERHPSVAPESLRKPFASLIPQSRSSTSPKPASWSETTPSMRPKSPRAICKKHKLAKSNSGDCMLCAKEKAERDGGFGWKLLLAFVFVAVLGAGIAAFFR